MKRRRLNTDRLAAASTVVATLVWLCGWAEGRDWNVEQALEVVGSSTKAADLADATLAIVQSGESSAIAKLVQRMSREAYLGAFAEDNGVEGEGRLSLGKLLNEIATQNSVAADHVLHRLAGDEAFSGRRGRRDRGKYLRIILVLKAMGGLKSPSHETYRVLQAALSRSEDYSELYALRSLVKIGTERTAKIIRRSLFQASPLSERTLLYISECARGRDRRPLFGLILAVAREASSDSLRAAALETLVAATSRPENPHDEVVSFPSYQTLNTEQRGRLLEVLDAVDTSGFNEASRAILDKLRGKLAE